MWWRYIKQQMLIVLFYFFIFEIIIPKYNSVNQICIYIVYKEVSLISIFLDLEPSCYAELQWPLPND